MKINEILTEAALTPYAKDTVETNNVLETIKHYCPQAAKYMFYNPLWRGFRKDYGDVLSMDPSKGERKSENTSNHYTLIMDNSPYMKNWPKRSKSLIAASSSNIASGYGKVYALFPFDGVKIAVCPGRDLWDTPLDLNEFDRSFGGDWDTLNCFLNDLGLEDTSYQGMVEYTKTPEFAEKLRRVTGELKINPAKFIPYLQEKMSPKNTGFRLMSIEEWGKNPEPMREVWFSGPCLMVKTGIYYSLV